MGSWVEIGEDFFKAIQGSFVPLDMRALKALKNSAFSLDLYAWAAFKTYSLRKQNKSQFVPWRALAMQLGANYAEPKAFGRKARENLKKVALHYPGFDYDIVRGGIRVHPGELAVPEKLKKLLR